VRPEIAQTMCITLACEQETIALGQALAAVLSSHHELAHNSTQNLMIYLHGDLGAGKSTLARALLRALGVQGAIKSPTYALLETYDTTLGLVLHLDLYRLSEPHELAYLGADELFTEAVVSLVEWPEKATGALPAPDLRLQLEHAAAGRTVDISAVSQTGQQFLSDLTAFFMVNAL
jgi:tRNA threonylcarbamoyladenosine biosynthesis protein TsaE